MTCMSKNFFIYTYLKKLYLCFALCFYALVKEGTVKWYFYFYTFGSNKVEKMIAIGYPVCLHSQNVVYKFTASCLRIGFWFIYYCILLPIYATWGIMMWENNHTCQYCGLDCQTRWLLWFLTDFWFEPVCKGSNWLKGVMLLSNSGRARNEVYSEITLGTVYSVLVQWVLLDINS